ncbi:hypothetical protein ACI6PS_09400 [Flavobacterium sp. PLA-1-15]|uniref:hypothetical protein n=1 Tax=Flavobacterium sp. PLA-1-15 TaxID=3380533 RepID=UPI003B7607D5
MADEIHVGKLIQKFIDRKNFKRTDVARKIGVPNTAIYANERQESLQTRNLIRMSHALKYNFFMDIANLLPREYESSTQLVADKDLLIQQQAEELQKLRWENNLLKELITAKK